MPCQICGEEVKADTNAYIGDGRVSRGWVAHRDCYHRFWDRVTEPTEADATRTMREVRDDVGAAMRATHGG